MGGGEHEPPVDDGASAELAGVAVLQLNLLYHTLHFSFYLSSFAKSSLDGSEENLQLNITY